MGQTPGGELAKRLRELFKRLEGTAGFYIKVVERAGRSVRSMFPLNNLWEGASGGRGEEEGITCYQGGEVIPNCTRQSILPRLWVEEEEESKKRQKTAKTSCLRSWRMNK